MGLVTVMEKLQLAPAAKLAPDTLKIAVDSLPADELAVCVNVDPEPQVLAAGNALMVALAITPAISMVNAPLDKALLLSVLVKVNVDVKVSPAAIMDASVLMVSVGA
ncbi:hypothetical protein MACH26_31260 [Planctobacterium marinum]|uniref:Uncharacterized protein n=1 Tax=Planctobacterium marinum TaxID=1631968 RepID=A0AA48I7W5_9ALTE|nr:hypothetical protein MACH26_31260 [Planctobacterium marinum]